MVFDALIYRFGDSSPLKQRKNSFERHFKGWFKYIKRWKYASNRSSLIEENQLMMFETFTIYESKRCAYNYWLRYPDLRSLNSVIIWYGRQSSFFWMIQYFDVGFETICEFYTRPAYHVRCYILYFDEQGF